MLHLPCWYSILSHVERLEAYCMPVYAPCFLISAIAAHETRIRSASVVPKMDPHADHACLSCAEKKRKCDRLLPSCSACLKQKRQCWYKANASVPAQENVNEQTRLQGSTEPTSTTDPRPESSLYPRSSVSQAAILPLTSDVVRTIGACLQCRTRKRKCDKVWPICGRCSRQYTHCDYSKQALVVDGPGASFLRSLDIGQLNATVPLPVESQPHMPMLIHSFLETFGMDPLPVDGGSLACLLRATWIQQALADPCAFHTTLYAASAHLDAFRGAKNSNMTLYHHTVALRLLQERINDPEAVFSESLMACVAPLVYFSALFGDKGSSTIHKMALVRMIKANGGLEHLALGMFLSELITICVLTETIIMDSTLDIPFLDIPPTALTPPSYFISAILRRAAKKKGGYYNLSPCTIEMFEDIESVAYLWPEDPVVIGIRAKWATRVENLLLLYPDHQDTGHNTNDVPIESDTEAMTQACDTAAIIFWLLFLDDHEYLAPFSMDVVQFLVGKLRYAISCGSMDTWVRAAPEAHTWVSLLGTAASVKLDDRVWFSLRHGQPVTCIESQGASVLLQSWSIYDWANQRRKQKMRVAALGRGDVLFEGRQGADERDENPEKGGR